MLKVKAILLSGGRLSPRLRREYGVRVKSLLPYQGKSLLTISISQSLLINTIEKPIAVIGPKDINSEVQRFGEDVVWLSEGSGVMDNVQIGANYFGWDNNFLLISPDLPLVTADDINAFLTAIPEDVDICVPIIFKEDFISAFPNCPNKFVQTKEGEITMGSLFFITGKALEKNIGLGKDAYKARKSPLKLASLLGVPIIVAFILKRLSVKDIEKRVSALTDAKARAIFVPLPRLAYDIDNEQNIRYLNELC